MYVVDGHELKLFLFSINSNFRCDCGNSKFSGNPCLLYLVSQLISVVQVLYVSY